MRYFSMFSGVGGFELGIGDAGECVGYSEIDKYAIKVYERHFKHENYGDATTINPEHLPDFDLLVGGFPCQSFSVAGKRGGFNDTRGTLFFDIARILTNKRPRHLVLENVKGLLSHDTGKTFQTILKVLSDLGYRVEWQVLNSKNHGVPQNRERVFIVGHFGAECTRKVFPLSGGGQETESTVHPTLDANYYKGPSNQRRMIKQLNHPKHSNDRVYSEDGISPTLNTAQGGLRQPFIASHYGHKNKPAVFSEHSPTLKAQSHAHEPMVVQPVLTPDRPIKRQNGRRFKENGEPSFTLTGQDKHGVQINSRIRRLTPMECERLQGFPDDYTAGESDTQRYKMCGNAVTVNVVKDLMEVLL